MRFNAYFCGMSNASPLPQLSAEEIRVLGSLMEKSRTTPELYPLSLVSLTTACNQKSARHPVVSYSQASVSSIVDVLRRKDLLTRVLGDGRVPKFRHNLAVKYPLVPSELAILTLLFLRGPLTVGEIRNLSSRLYDFEDLAEVAATLDKLSQNDPPYVQSIGRGHGQKEPRYAHLFAPVDLSMLSNSDPDELQSHLSGESSASLPSRIAQMEARIASLEAALQTAGLWSPAEDVSTDEIDRNPN
jgi:uncharacterized protein YceH (UPF0502 family)